MHKDLKTETKGPEIFLPRTKPVPDFYEKVFNLLCGGFLYGGALCGIVGVLLIIGFIHSGHFLTL
ncbi:hypothetical protein [Paremcibacter congregatus]|uniref:hypothetical protein n=1 Tax=Paremcibacter congregatus TaxID=2043170 RepID=UPI0030EBFF47|tara:strand:- start:2314 stop:2508 length:195 start_codon:yes stop_codon:yes gene_type:complete